MVTLKWNDEAQRWLRDIFDYIAADNPLAAVRTIDGIYERAQVLSTFPEIGHRYIASSRNVRILLYGHYRISYIIKADKSIDVLGVFHGALDIERSASNGNCSAGWAYKFCALAHGSVLLPAWE